MDSSRRERRGEVSSSRNRFESIGHLGPEAVVAFVDGEMDLKSVDRVRLHLVHCAECRAEIHAQRGTSAWVRQTDGQSDVRVPHGLMDKLAGIAEGECAAGPDAETPAFEPRQDFLDKLEMVVRAIRHNQRG